MEHVTSCGAIIYQLQDNEIKYLLIQQIQNHDWTFPKGHMEAGENYRQTALREVKEETNLDIEIVEGFQEQVSYSHEPGKLKTVIFFLAQPINQDLKGQEEEINDLVWLSYKKALEQLTYPDFKKLLISAHQFINREPNLNKL